MSKTDCTELVRSFNDWAERSEWPTRCDTVLSFNSVMLREALAVWRHKAVGCEYPSRAGMTPRAMKNFLPHVAIVDIDESGNKLRSRLRVTGSWIDRHLMAASSQYLDEVLPEPFLGRWQSVLKLALDVEGPVRSVSDPLQYRNQEYLAAETLFAPLAEAGEKPNAVMAVMTVHSRFARPLDASKSLGKIV